MLTWMYVCIVHLGRRAITSNLYYFVWMHMHVVRLGRPAIGTNLYIHPGQPAITSNLRYSTNTYLDAYICLVCPGWRAIISNLRYSTNTYLDAYMPTSYMTCYYIQLTLLFLDAHTHSPSWMTCYHIQLMLLNKCLSGCIYMPSPSWTTCYYIQLRLLYLDAHVVRLGRLAITINVVRPGQGA